MLTSTSRCSGSTYWAGLAQCYAALGPPLRPSAEDIRFMESAVAGRMAAQALLLGVTPDIAGMKWPPGTRLIGVDNAFAMAREVWPGNVPGRSQVVCADWLDLPIAERSCDVVIGDGSLAMLPYPQGYRNLADTLSAVLVDDGILILRCYVRPERTESPDEVLADCGVASFHHLKLRLLMAMQPSTRRGVAVNDVYRFWASRSVDERALADATGWDRKSIAMMELYRESETAYTFPTRAELDAVLCNRFEELTAAIPSGSMGERFPTLTFRPRQRA